MFVSIFNPHSRRTARCIVGGLRLRRMVLLCCLTLIAISSGCNQDRAQWKVAAAINEEKNGNSEAAIELLQTALRMDPDSNSIKMRLASLLAQNDQGDLGLTLCDEILESDSRFKQVWRVRSDCLLHLGRFKEALADYQKHVAGNIDKDSMELNQLAYYRGLAGCELDKALRQANLGIRKVEQQQHWGRFSNVPIEVSSIVSAGLLSRHTTDGHLFVMDLLNDSIWEEQEIWLQLNARLEAVLARHEREKEENLSEDADDLLASRQAGETKRATNNLKTVSGNLTVLLGTRSLIFEDQGQSKLADLDRLWLKRIGFEPEEIYRALPNDSECLAALQTGEAILDTRGFILTQLPWLPSWTTPEGKVLRMKNDQALTSYGSYKAAMRDLDIAVAASEITLLAFNSGIVNRIEIPVQDVQVLKGMQDRMIAVLRNHRREAHLKANQLEAANQDLMRIKELGLEAGPCLF